MPDQMSKNAVETSERFADGWENEKALHAAQAEIGGLRHSRGGWLAAWAAAETAGPDASTAAFWVPSWAADAAGEANARLALAVDPSIPAKEIGASAWRQQRQRQCDMLRDIFPNPLAPEPNAVHLAWRSNAVIRAARTAYDQGGADDLAHLARLLEQAGCDSKELLEHCRASTGHVRGCWALDLILGLRPRRSRPENTCKEQTAVIRVENRIARSLTHASRKRPLSACA
jgi:hypothetical protein